jgi:hypothetical protein
MKKSEIREMVKEELLKEKTEDKIVVKGVGTYKYKSLTKVLQEKSKDLYEQSKTGKFDKISSSSVEIFYDM